MAFSDGSTADWELLGLLDAGSVAAVVPGWVYSTWADHQLPNATNTDGSFNCSTRTPIAAARLPAEHGQERHRAAGHVLRRVPGQRFPRTEGAKLDGERLAGRCASAATTAPAAPTTTTPPTAARPGRVRRVRRGLKLYGVAGRCPAWGTTRRRGTSILPGDWYTAEVDLAGGAPDEPDGRGRWWLLGQPLLLRRLERRRSDNRRDGRADPGRDEALVLPDPDKFATLGLQQGTPLSINPATNPVTSPPGTHTVTGITGSTGGTPIPGVTITFKVLTGPNAGATGTGVTRTNGERFSPTPTAAAPVTTASRPT